MKQRLGCLDGKLTSVVPAGSLVHQQMIVTLTLPCRVPSPQKAGSDTNPAAQDTHELRYIVYGIANRTSLGKTFVNSL